MSLKSIHFAFARLLQGIAVGAAWLLISTTASAMPMPSSDGCSLTGVDVGGTLYDVVFGDGVVSTVYAGVAFDAARAVEANAVSAAIVAALNAVGGVSPLPYSVWASLALAGSVAIKRKLKA